MSRTQTDKVETLVSPEVEHKLHPVIIGNIMTASVACVNSPSGSVLNPAVLGVPWQRMPCARATCTGNLEGHLVRMVPVADGLPTPVNIANGNTVTEKIGARRAEPMGYLGLSG
ncbi:MAG: hypothetical protein AAGF97_02945 [Planctomycetota bacterium]